MDTILKVCKKEIIPSPKKISYNKDIEDNIKIISSKLKEILSLPPYLLRWIALKIMDGDEKILTSIEKNFNFSFSDYESIKLKQSENVNNEHINNNDFKDSIVSSIMKRSESICKKVCTFENKNYSRT